MTAVQEFVGTPTLPRVNLLPPEFAAEDRFHKLRTVAIAAVAASVVLVGGGYLVAHSTAGSAQSALDDAMTKRQHVDQQVAHYQYVPRTKALLDAANKQLAQATANDIHWSNELQAVTTAVPQDLWITNIGVQNLTGGKPAAKPGSSASAPPSNVVAIITLQGNAASHDSVSALLQQLATLKGFTSPYLTSSVEGATADHSKALIAWTVTVELTTDSLARNAAPSSVGG